MSYSEEQYSLLRLMYKNVDYIINDLYYASNYDFFNFVNNDPKGYIIDTNLGKIIEVSEFHINVVSGYIIITFKKDKKHIAFVYDEETSEFVGDISYKYGGARETNRVINLKDDKLAFIYQKNNYFTGEPEGQDVIILDKQNKKMIKTGKVDMFDELVDRIVFIGYNNKYSEELYTRYEFMKEIV